jgi:hypothetical protein
MVGAVIRRLAALVVAAAVSASVTSSVGAAPVRPAVAPPSQRVYMVSDSVGLGTRGAIQRAFPSDWQVTLDGTPALFVEMMESQHVRRRMATDPSVFGDIAVVAGGYNYPYWDPARFDRSIDSMIRALRQAGAKQILWVTLREVKPEFITPSAWRQVQPYFWYFPEVNQHLRDALTRHPDLTLVDWAAIADRTGLTYDAIHLNTTGAAVYSAEVARVAMAAGNRPAAASVRAVPVAGVGGVGAAPAAVMTNLSVTDARVAGFHTAAACGGSLPFVASGTYERDQVVSVAAIVPVTPPGTPTGAGSICVAPSQSTHQIADVSGWFPVGSGYVAVTPRRLADTRDSGARRAAGTPLVVPVTPAPGVPNGVAAVAVTVTVTDPIGAGFATVTPCGVVPSGTANVNFDAGATVPNLVIAEPGDGGAICVTPSVDAHLVVDLFGSFEPTAELDVLTPTRLVDTRVEPGRRPGAGGVVRLNVRAAGVPADANGVMLNLAATAADGDGYLTAYPCAAGLTTAANLTVRSRGTRSNFVLVGPDPVGEVCVYSSAGADVVVDLLGWIGAPFVAVTPFRVLDTRLDPR